MKSIVKFLAIATAIQFSSVAVAGEFLTIKSFGRPFNEYAFTAAGSTLNGVVLDVKTLNPINCSGTSTNSVRFYLGSNFSTDVSSSSAAFLAGAEIISAAKTSIVIETVGTLFFHASYGGCSVFHYQINVQ